VSESSNAVYASSEVAVTFFYDFQISRLTATWSEVLAAPRPGFDVSLLKDGSQIAHQENVSTTITTFDLAGLGVYTVQVRQNGDSTHIPAAWSQPSGAVTVPVAVVVTLAYRNNKLTATWNDVQPPNYDVNLLKDGQPFGATTTAANHAEFDPQGPAGVYTVQVKPNSRWTYVGGQWSNPSNAVPQLAAPNIAFASIHGEDDIGVRVDSDSDSYSIQLLKNGAAFGPIATGTTSQSAALLNAKDLAPGEYYVQVRANGADDQAIPSQWIIARNTIYKLAAPSIAALEHSKDKASRGAVIVTLQNAVDGADRYAVQFVNPADETPVGSVSYGRRTVIEIDANDIPPGTYKLKAKAERINNDFAYGFASAWNVSTATITVFERVTINAIAYADNIVTAAWSASVVATSYEFVLSEDSVSPTQPVASATISAPAGQTVPPSSLSLPVANITKDKVYTAYVRPVANAPAADWGDWSAGAAVTIGPSNVPATGTIQSVTPAAQVAAGAGQLLWIRGNHMPATSATEIWFLQAGQEYHPQWAAYASPDLVVVRLPSELQPGAATVRLTNATQASTTADFALTISATPGTPVITKVAAAPNGPAVTAVAPGQQIWIYAEGIDTSGAVLEWTHPTLAMLPGAADFTAGLPGGTTLAVVTKVPAVTTNDTWTLNLRVRVENKLSPASSIALQTGAGNGNQA
jgi:hypothetical protein